MKRAILFPLLWLLTFSLTAQVYNKKDAQGRKTGLWKKLYSNGKVHYQGQFKEDMPYGVFKYYNPNGQLIARLEYYDGGHRSKVTKFYNRGKVQAKGFYHDKQKDSLWIYYDESSGQKVKEERYHDGIKHGWWRIYYISGQLYSEVLWKEGIKEGPWREFLPDGSKRLETFYRAGKLDGPYKLYALGEVLIKEGKYHMDKMDGLWKIYDDNGHLIREEEYIMGWLKLERKYINGVLSETIDHRYKNKVVPIKGKPKG